MSASVTLTATENLLLAALPPGEHARLQSSFEKVSFDLGDIVHDTGGLLDYVYFPTSCIVSLIYITENGSSAEMGLVGNEGVVGFAVLLGGNTSPNRAVVQIAGNALKIKAKVLLGESERNLPFQRLLLLYTQSLITQVSQTAVCNRLHTIEQRLCRRILLCHDRLQSDEMQMTQEFVASMLGCRRQSITEAAGHLQDAGLIHYARGHISILDRPGLERRVCECYQVVKTELDRLMNERRTMDRYH